MAANDKVSPGEQFRPPLAATWNAMVDAGEAFRASQQSQQLGAAAARRSTDIIKCRNDSGSDRRRGEILGAFSNPLTNLDAEKLRLAGDEPIEDDHFGILLKATPDGDYGDLQVSGACLALVDITNEDHTRARADGTGHVLVSADDGPIEILYKPEGTGEELCCVRFGSSGGGWLLKTTEAIPARSGTTMGSGDCVICTRSGASIVETDEEIVAYNAQAGESIPAYTYVQAKSWQGVPLIDVAECE